MIPPMDADRQAEALHRLRTERIETGPIEPDQEDEIEAWIDVLVDMALED